MNAKLIVIFMLIYIASSNSYALKTPPLENINVQLMWKHQFEFAGLYAAIEQGYYEKAGLKVTLNEYQNNINIIEEVISGRAQYGISDSTLIIHKANNVPVVLLANIFQHSPMVLLSHAGSGILSPAQMPGKTIMLSTDNQDNASIIAMLNSESVDLNTMNIKPHTFNLDDFINHNVDIISAYASNETARLNSLGIKFHIIDPINYGIDFYGDNLFTSEEQQQKHPEQTAKFIKASLQGWQYAINHPNQIIDLILKKYSTTKSKSELKYEAKTLNRFILADYIPLGSIDMTRIQIIIDVYKKLNLIKENINLSTFIYQHKTPLNKSLQLTTEEVLWIKQHPDIKMGVDPGWAPFEFINAQGKYSGMAADYIKLIAKKTGLNFIPQKHATWSEVIKNTRAGNIEILPAVMPSLLRKEFLNFSTAYINYPMVIVTNKKYKFVSNLNDLNQKTVTVVTNYITEDILRNKHPNIHLKSAKNLQQALQWVSDGEVDALVDNLASISHSISILGITNLKVSGTTPYDFTLSIGVHKNSRLLFNIIQKALKSIDENQRKIIQDKWIRLHTGPFIHYRQAISFSIILFLFILFVLLWNRRLSHEIKARKKAEKKLQEHQEILHHKNNILELLSKGFHLSGILETLILYLEKSHPDMIGSVLLLDKQKQHLIDTVALSLPKSYIDAINGIKIGIGVGSCGTAAITGKTVIVEDIMKHPYWQPYKSLAKKAQLSACFSEPILSSNHEILGTFTIYYRTSKKPTQENLNLIHEMSILAALAIENHEQHATLKKLSLAVEYSDNIVIITDKQGIIEYVNPKFTEISGYSSYEALGNTPRLLKSNFTPKTVYENLWQTLLSGKSWQGEFHNRKKSGELYWVWDHIASIKNSSGKITHFVSTQQDFTQRKQAEHLLKNSETQFRTLVENTNIVAWKLDLKSFLFTYVSPHAETMLGYSRTEWMHKNFWIQHIVAADKQKTIQYCMTKTRKGLNHQVEYRIEKNNGKKIWLRNIISVIKNNQGVPISLSGFLIDIDERKKTEIALQKAKQEAEQANKAKSNFLATMTHELRTPMNGVLGMAQILEETDLNHTQREHVDVILHSGKSLLNIINNVLNFSKLESTQPLLEKIHFNLEHVITDILSLLAPEIQEKSLSVTLFYPPNYPRNFIGDVTRLQQILLNLTTNAIKFTSIGYVKIVIFCQIEHKQQANLEISIEDTGIGIEQKNITQLFEPFIQADQSTTRKFGGSGLGLSICKKLILLMNGHIEIKSIINKGSKFTVYLSLPISNIDSTPTQEKTTLNLLNFNAKLLIVEDDLINQKIAKTLLHSTKIHIDIANNGQEAVTLYKKNHYHLILMDCRMPVMDGYQATRVIRELEAGSTLSTPIIALTANSAIEDTQRCLASGMNDIITKPFEKITLLQCLKQWIDSDLQQSSFTHDNKTRALTSHITDINQTFNKATFKKFKLEMDGDFLEIYHSILNTIQNSFQYLEAALLIKDYKKLSLLAHSLKSPAANLGAIQLKNIAEKIEFSAQQFIPQNLNEEIKALKKEYDYLLIELKKMNIN